MRPRLVITRPRAQARPWLQVLHSKGLDVVCLPLLSIEALTDETALQALRSAWSEIGSQSLVMFVSANAAEHFFAAAPGQAWPQQVLAGSTGAGTSDALLAAGVPSAAIVAPAPGQNSDSEALWTQLETRPWAGKGVLIVRGEDGRNWLGERLQGAGARVQALAAYRRTSPVLSEVEHAVLAAALAAPEAHLWHFSSSEAVSHLRDLAPGARWHKSRALATHPRIRETALGLGFGQVDEVAPGLSAVLEHPSFLESRG